MIRSRLRTGAKKMSDSGTAISAMNDLLQEVDQVAATAIGQPWSKELVEFLALSVLGFTTIALIVAASLLWRAGSDQGPVLKVVGIICIVGLSALLLVIGFFPYEGTWKEGSQHTAGRMTTRN